MRKLNDAISVAWFATKLWLVNALRIARYWLDDRRWEVCQSCGYVTRPSNCRWVAMKGGRWESHCGDCRRFTELARVVVNR